MRTSRFPFLLFLCLLQLALPSSAETSDLQIHILDVGQGDAMILDQPGACTVLIDAGPLVYGHRVTNKLQELSVTEVDAVIITHPHLDHFGGLFDLVPRIPIGHLYDNGQANQVQEYFDDYETLRQSLPYGMMKQGMDLSCGDIHIATLHSPDIEFDEKDLNGASLVMMISFGNFKLLHMGDLSGKAETLFLANNTNIRANAIKIAHHGAADATSEQLLDAVHPEIAVISSGNKNRIGAPANEVLERIAKREITLYRTDLVQNIKLIVSKNGYTYSID